MTPRSFHLAPHVALQYWMTRPSLREVAPPYAEYATLTVNRIGECTGISARFDLPAQSDQLAASVAAVNAAYALGRRDVGNWFRALLGLSRLPTDLEPLPLVMRGHDDRD